MKTAFALAAAALLAAPVAAQDESKGPGCLIPDTAADAAPRATAPRPRPDLGAFFTPEDYPASARAAREQGDVEVRLSVGADGRVTGCAILESSGSAALDSATCRLLQTRARFRPALDADGRPAPTEMIHRHAWRLPG